MEPSPDWRDRAACLGQWDVFDAASNGHPHDAEKGKELRWAAAEICATCPVRLDCYLDCINDRDNTIEQVRAGMWWGRFKEQPPAHIAKPKRIKREPVEVRHGTHAGYERHRRGTQGWDTTPCDDCSTAKAAYSRENRAARKAAGL